MLVKQRQRMKEIKLPWQLNTSFGSKNFLKKAMETRIFYVRVLKAYLKLYQRKIYGPKKMSLLLHRKTKIKIYIPHLKKAEEQGVVGTCLQEAQAKNT